MQWSQRVVVAAILTAGLLLAPAAPAAPAGEGGALVVGDSLEVLTSPYLRRHLPGIPLTISAEGGYNSNQIRELFEQSYDPSQSVIVFDAGTNDNPAYPQILAANLTAVAAAIGERCMVVPTIHGFTVNGVGNEGKNLVVAEFAASRPGTQVPDWAAAAVTQPQLMQPDGLHPTPAGADLRARLIARGIRGCLAFLSGGGSSGSGRPEPRVERPEMSPVGRMAARQAALGREIAMALGGRLVLQLASPPAPLAALALAALESGGPDA
jgi:lysophospholipase L1-like esterase